MFLEYSKKLSVGMSIEEATKRGFYTIWDDERIQKAFKGGNGTIKDFKRYIEDNKNYIFVIEA